MRLSIRRTLKNNEFTEGSLFIDGEFFCNTLELFDSGLSMQDGTTAIKLKKKERKICIPYGTYPVVINYSPRFKKALPLLLNVPGFSGIRIHTGNTVKDSEGCILVGIKTDDGYVAKSKETFNRLMQRIQNSSSNVTITIQ